MKKLPPKERPALCDLRPLSWEEVISSTDVPLWLEIKGFEHLNQWCLIDVDDFNGAIMARTRKGTYDIQKEYGKTFLAYSPVPDEPKQG